MRLKLSKCNGPSDNAFSWDIDLGKPSGNVQDSISYI